MYAGCNPYKVGLKIHYNKGGKSLISYDLREEKEINSIEICDHSIVFFDSEGDIYAVEGETFNMVEKQTRLTCF